MCGISDVKKIEGSPLIKTTRDNYAFKADRPQPRFLINQDMIFSEALLSQKTVIYLGISMFRTRHMLRVLMRKTWETATGDPFFPLRLNVQVVSCETEREPDTAWPIPPRPVFNIDVSEKCQISRTYILFVTRERIPISIT